jgi:glycosyltransferase involved in cell wall biosynthesis
MNEDPRIIFLKNSENKGALYTKSKGILMAKGKYVLTLDVDDLYTSEYTFSTLLNIAEKNNLDLLGFCIMMSERNILKKGFSFHHDWETEVLFQPNVSYMMYSFDKDNKPKRVGDVISAYLMKRIILVASIKEIDNETMNKKIIHHDDLFIFFLLSRKAKNIKQIKTPFYLCLYNPGYNQTLIDLHIKEKTKLHIEYGCLSYLYYIKFILKKTSDSFVDKQIASLELKNWYLDNYCRNDLYSKETGIQICKLFLKNKYINDDIKTEIRVFLNETKN